MRDTARVPATAANLGSGFDCLGVALELRNEIVLDLGEPFGIEVEGEGQDRLPRDGRNMVARTIEGFFERLGRPAPPFSLTLRNRIPLTGGLGSSSATLVGALLVANVAAGNVTVQATAGGHTLRQHVVNARADVITVTEIRP